MRLDLALLVWATALTLLQGIIAAVGTIPQLGLPAIAGNRENLPPIQGWAGRAQRAHRNMLESLVLFAALVLVAHAAGRSNAMTVLGAQFSFGPSQLMPQFTSPASHGFAPWCGPSPSSDWR